MTLNASIPSNSVTPWAERFNAISLQTRIQDLASLQAFAAEQASNSDLDEENRIRYQFDFVHLQLVISELTTAQNHVAEAQSLFAKHFELSDSDDHWIKQAAKL